VNVNKPHVIKELPTQKAAYQPHLRGPFPPARVIRSVATSCSVCSTSVNIWCQAVTNPLVRHFCLVSRFLYKFSIPNYSSLFHACNFPRNTYQLNSSSLTVNKLTVNYTERPIHAT
jgi:hypothetical protein